ncbi:hypothetical protein BIY21_14085 [Vibrio ponticus]|uniref:Polysaccharide pyruvyl transferase domain-containing protein n=1 Tax=Vibrio ponticus TaxID=265668 RepID=A0ABX3FH23_9VIBR|nr:polysaccharide pyruvyl transferase family protein [Vibrio ponticus]OLQ89956.1 hypothetical protein BIY21_14085 [Vibrio ponticus]
MNNILLVNEGSSDNIGDQALNKGLFHCLSSLDLKVKQIDLTRCRSSDSVSNNENHFKVTTERVINKKANRNHWFWVLLSRIKWGLSNIRKVFLLTKGNYDALVVGGGQLILDNRYFPVALLVWSLIARFRRIPIYFVSVGVGSKFSFGSKLMFRCTLSLSEKVLVRDEVSRDNLRNNFNIESTVTFDSAYAYPLPTTSLKNKRRLIVGVTNYEIYKRYFSELEFSERRLNETEYIDKWVNSILSLNVSTVVFCSTSSEDIDISHKVYIRLLEKKEGMEIRFIDRVPPLEEYVSLVLDSGSVFSGRMHALILSELCGNYIKPWVLSQKIDTYNKFILPTSVEKKRKHIYDEVKSLFA